MTELIPFWEPPGFRPMSEGAIAALCNADAGPEIKELRAKTLIIGVHDHQAERIK